MISWLQTCLVILVILHAQIFYCRASDAYKVVCYFSSWAGYRSGKGEFDPENIDPTLCTHLIYSHVGITDDGTIKILDEWIDLPSGKGGFQHFVYLKSLNSDVKVLASIGGWNEGSKTYSAVVNSDRRRAILVHSILNFLKEYGFDGIDLDWEYPAQRGGLSSDKDAFVKLLKELRSELDKQGYLLTAAVGADHDFVGSSYDVPEISKYVDFINMQSFDIHGPWDGYTGQNAPLYASSVDTTDDAKTRNVDASIRYWIQNGADPKKLVLGIATYGHSYTLPSEGLVGPGAVCIRGGKIGPYTEEEGFLGYNEICELEQKEDWTVVWDDEQKVPYASKGDQWVGYDNVESVKLKAQYIIELGLAGAMISGIDTDDFLGKCHGIKFPLLTAINEVLN